MKAIPTKTSLLLFDTILEKSNLQENHFAADLGCGKSLFFLYSLAKIVGKGGQVYGVDILPEVIESLQSDISHHRLNSISAIQGDIESKLDIPSQSLHSAFLINTLSQATNTIAMLSEAARLLQTDGRLVIVDWSADQSPFGPLLSQRLSADEVINSLDVSGLKLLDQFQAGPYHYGIVASK